MAWLNADGLLQRFASDYRRKPANVARALPSSGHVKELVFEYDLTRVAAGATSYPDDLNNDGTNDGFSGEHPCLPANAVVLGVTLKVDVAAAGGTSITFGTFQADGTAIDADGLITATEGVIANMNAVGEQINGNGAQVALSSNTKLSIGTNPGYLALVAAGTFTAGRGKIYVQYV